MCYHNPYTMITQSTHVSSPRFNIFAHSDFGLDTLQARVFTLLLENIGSYEQMLPVKVRIEDVLGANPTQHHYTLLEDALDGLSGKRLRQSGKNSQRACFYPVFHYMRYCPDEGGIIEAQFSDLVKEPLKELTSNFSIKEISKFVMLRHSHTQRLFWFLRGYVNESKVELTVEELKDVLLGVRKYRQKDAEYERYYDFKTRVVDQAIKTIRDKGLLDIRYREYRHKRNVVRLVFRVNSCSGISKMPEQPRQMVLF